MAWDWVGLDTDADTKGYGQAVGIVVEEDVV